jgi:hypothetical protein
MRKSSNNEFSHIFRVVRLLVQGEFHDPGDANWIVVRRQLRGHNNTPFGWQTPIRHIGLAAQGLAALWAYLVV